MFYRIVSYRIVSNCPNKQSDSDPIPTWLLKECSSFLVPTITNIVNLSLISGQFHFHPTLKESIISPLLKKPTLDKEELSNYRSISNLSLISKIIERVVKSRLMDHLTSNSLLNFRQSAYCKHHSTETTLLYTVSQKKQDTKLLPITSPNVNRFSKLFHW